MNPKHELEILDRQWGAEIELHRFAARRQTLGAMAGVALMAGPGFVLLGLWLNDLGEEARLERMLHPWPFGSVVLGVLVVLGAAIFMVQNDRHIWAYDTGKPDDTSQREELLQEIDTSESD